MSSTMVVTMAVPSLSTTDISPSLNCPSCGHDIPSPDQAHADLLAAQNRIADLETQVRLLNQKATAAVDRWADYEDELSRMRAQLAISKTPAAPLVLPEPISPPPQPSPTRTSFLQAGTNRLSALLSPRKSAPALNAVPEARPTISRSPNSVPAPPLSPAGSVATTEDLIEALTREQSLRKEAEGRVLATSKEVEELSAALFEQANQMVADERRARARLEERVGELEKRDNEKRRRLERLEMAMARIERVRGLLEENVELQGDYSPVSETDETRPH
ncbi:hypothetical protein B0I35DRAFT_246136 [Stachybotrys elegans]|uniref:GDP/GTP exchange factor Sec2 N-terminal domain-containing protein n=1 Tax=Stachybotrys elegans TaxID=80388 RepID=A0A8K0SWN3_9HYPO|nr:hypothetical protein B0I35DRAFT_246136 [Stachybotrys elegans]